MLCFLSVASLLCVHIYLLFWCKLWSRPGTILSLMFLSSFSVHAKKSAWTLRVNKPISMSFHHSTVSTGNNHTNARLSTSRIPTWSQFAVQGRWSSYTRPLFFVSNGRQQAERSIWACRKSLQLEMTAPTDTADNAGSAGLARTPSHNAVSNDRPRHAKANRQHRQHTQRVG